MTLDEKIGQLFIIPASPSMGEKHRQELLHVIKTYKIGGIILKGTSIESRKWLQDFDDSMLICVDAEWGLGMRMTDQMSFPKNLTLGAVQNTRLLYELGLEIGKQVRNFGAHLNLAPVVDVNNNPNNPIIHMRSFGQDPESVAKRGALMMQGMQDAGIFVCAKHFPGHGDTGIDSHLQLPKIEHDLKHLDTIELFPFKRLTSQGADFVMTAHLLFPELDTLPATLSKKIVQSLLREKLDYQGMVITDALNMKALANHYSVEEIALLAHTAGHDFLLYGDHIFPNIDQILSNDIPKAFKAIKSAYVSGELDEKDLDKTVNRILSLKKKMQKFQYDPNYDLSHARALKRELYREAITLVQDRQVLLPLRHQSLAYMSIGKEEMDPLGKIFQKDQVPVFHQPLEVDELKVKRLLHQAQKFETIVIGLSLTKALDPKIISLMHTLQENTQVIVVLFGSPYLLKGLDQMETLLLAYEADPVAYEVVYEALKGKKNLIGRLPVTY